ncbi:cadherin domain-containing protein [Rubritalea tangerina]|uniref:Cadherin domain-containing protein n=1 Tax=Rubritalea tangerina TaxID=430798 RepID=A0ABW4ZAN0_9BACT
MTKRTSRRWGSLMTAGTLLLGSWQLSLANLPETFTVTVDKGGGEMVDLTLSKYSIRSNNCRIVTWDSTNGYVEVHTSANPGMPARTYRGHVTQNPNELVMAVVHSDYTLQVDVHDGSGRVWTASGIDVTAELGNGTSTVPTPAPHSAGTGTPVAHGLPGAHLPVVGLYRAHGVEDIPSQFFDLNGQNVEQTLVWLEHQWNIFDFFNARDCKLSMELTEVIIRKEQFYFPQAGTGQFTTMLRNEWAAQGQNKRGFVHSWFPYNFTYAGGYASGNEFYGSGHCISVNALYHEVAHNWRAQHYFYGKETMTGSHPAHTEMNSQRVLYTRQLQIDQDDGIELLTNYATNLHPRAYQDVASTLVNTAVDVSPLENDYDANGDAISIKDFTATTAKGGTVTESNGVLTYTPANGYVGKDVVVYEVQDTAGLFTKNAIHIEVVNQGLAAQWTMEDSSGANATDSSGNGHTGSVVGTDFSSASVPGPVGNALALGSSDYMIGDSSNLITHADTTYPLDAAASNFFDPMDRDFSVATWVKLGDQTASANLFTKINNANLGYKVTASQASGITASLRVWDGFEGTFSVSSGQALAAGGWYHVAMVINRGDNTLRLYVNGAEVGSAASIPSGYFIFNGREDFKIGGAGAITVDDTQIYTKALSLAEVQALHDAGEVPAAPLNPSNGDLNLAFEADLEWLAGNATYQHDVYFGTDAASVASATTASPEYQGRQSGTSFDPGTLDPSKTYFWRIDEVDGSSIIAGDVWSFHTAASALNSNLVLHLSMDDEDVQTADGVTHTYDDTAFPAQDFQAVGTLVTGSAGVIGEALDLTGSSDTIRSYVSNPVSRPSAGGVTVSFWINTSSTQNGGEKVYDAGGAYFLRYYNGDLMPVFDGSSGGAVTFDTNINDGQWHHIVATNDGAGLTTLYVDGVSVGTQSEGLHNVASLNRTMGIGATYNGTGENLEASFDDFAVWERALSVSEITDIHTAGLAGNSFNDIDVLVDTSFDESDGFTGFNAGGTASLGTVVDNNGVTWTEVTDAKIWNRSDIPPAGIQALVFGVSGGGTGQCDVSIPGTTEGVGIVSFDYASFSSSANATFRLLYNDNTGSGWVEAWSTQVVGMNPDFSDKPWGSAEVAINVPGDVDLRFETSGTKGAKIDNVKVTGLPYTVTNIAPVVNDTAGSVAENTPAGAAIATVVASDSNPGDSVSYAITGGNTGGVFAIDSNGAITTTAALDYEANSQYVLTVTATDNGGLNDTASVTVDVSNVNEAPSATGGVASLAEDATAGSAALTVGVTDPDSADSFSYAITAGNTGGAFSVDTNGVVRVASALDFETTTSYALTITVTDAGGLSDTAAVTLNVTNVNEAVVANDTSGSVAEDATTGTAVATVSSSDPDAGDSVSFAITAGNTGNVFAIDHSGVITTAGALDYEATASYSLTVTATDGGGLSDTANVSVTVTNVNEAVVANDTSGSVAEDATTGTAVATVSSSDPDAGDSVSFAITAGNTGNVFAIDNSGVITTAGALDYEATASYSLTVTATDGGGLSDTANVSVTVTNVNESPLASDNSGTVAEDVSIGTAVATVSATDPDAGDSVSYAIIAGNTGSAFAIDSNTGEITTAAVLDFETLASYTLTVEVTDGGGLSDSATVTVTVTNVQESIFRSNWQALADQNPVADPSTYFDGTVATLEGSIDFENVSGNLRLWNGGVGDKDFIGSGSSDVFENVIEITSAQYANDTEYTLSYVVGTGSSSSRTGDWFVEFGTRDGGVFTPLGVVDSGSASNVTGSLALNSDENLMDNANNSALFGGNVGGRILTVTFNPGDAATGKNIAFRFGTTSSNLFAGISDMLLDSTAVVDPNLAPVANDTSGSVAEDATLGTTVATVSASDPDAGDSLSYAITAGNTGGAFAIDNSGVITTATALDYETTNSYTLTVTVTDNGGLSDTASVSVSVTDVLEVTAAVVATGSASNLAMTSADLGYSITDEGGEAPSVTLYYGETDGGTTPASWSNSVVLGTKNAGAHVESITGLSEGTSYYYTIAATNTAGTVWGSSASFTTVADTSPKMVRTTVSGVSSSSWTNVDLGKNYNSAVIVATPIYASAAQVPVVTRIRNVSGSSFEVKLDRADGLTAAVICDVSVIAVEEGVYTLASDGVQMEAVKFTSTVTAAKSSWLAEARSYTNSYTTPVVLGQVMSANDANWSVFWSMGNTRTAPADVSNLNIGKHVAEDSNTVRADETIGYIVIEAGTGSINGVAYEAGLGADTVRNTSNSAAGYSYGLTGLSSASAGALSSAGMDGADGGWPVFFENDALSASAIKLIIDEDDIGDSESSHTTEQVNYLIFE